MTLALWFFTVLGVLVIGAALIVVMSCVNDSLDAVDGLDRLEKSHFEEVKP